MASAKQPRRIEFKTGRIIKRNRRAMARAFDKVAKQMTQSIRKRISKPYPPASRPGAHPHKRTGFLKRNTEVVRKGFSLFVRTPQQGVWLEGGTKNMAARPFIRRNIHDKRGFWTRRINTEIRRATEGG